MVRLVNGPTKYEGRVEVYHNGEWGTVCDNGWDMNDAQVVCGELGLGYAVAASHDAFYGQGNGQIWLNNLNCVGSEGTIGDCTHEGWGVESCTHSEDAGVKCIKGTYVSYRAKFWRGKPLTNQMPFTIILASQVQLKYFDLVFNKNYVTMISA